MPLPIPHVLFSKEMDSLARYTMVLIIEIVPVTLDNEILPILNSQKFLHSHLHLGVFSREEDRYKQLNKGHRRTKTASIRSHQNSAYPIALGLSKLQIAPRSLSYHRIEKGLEFRFLSISK